MIAMPDGHPGVRGHGHGQSHGGHGQGPTVPVPPAAPDALQAAGNMGTAGGRLGFGSAFGGLGTSINDTFIINPRADGLQSENSSLSDAKRLEAMKAATASQLMQQFGGSGKGASGVAAHNGYATHAPTTRNIAQISDSAGADASGPVSEETLRHQREQHDEKFKTVQQGKAVITAEPDVAISADKIGLGAMMKSGRNF